jgi:hypothetical protein
LMQGGATGADQFAMEWAATKPEIKRYVCHADWETHGARQDRSETRRC